MTVLTPITKFMAHLPLAYHQGRPQNALIICFGMGTTYRSALSWDIETTAVELVPSVKKVFGFFFADAKQQLSNPRGQVIIDDGRRYLSRTRGAFDAIVIDPPPPITAAGVSLLYSKDFYTLAKQRLRPGGILQTWFAERDTQVRRAALKAITESFPYVRCFEPMEGYGLHVLASMEPIESCSAEELVQRMPAKARADLSEWNPGMALPDYVRLVLRRELPISRLVNLEMEVPLTDDLPYNEYYLMRLLGWL